MKEVVSLYIGQAGIQIGESCWNLFRHEHGISEAGKFEDQNNGNNDNNSHLVYFTTTSHNSIVPRALLVDTDSSVIDGIKTTDFGSIFPSGHFVHGQTDAANNWAKGWRSMSTLGENVVERLRRICDDCTSLQGILLFSSCGGGTGSGLGSALLERLKDDLGEKCPLFSFSIWPSPKLSSSVVEPYNTVLSMPSQVDAATISTVMDNQALYDICLNQLQNKLPSYTNLNQLISQTVTSWTSSLRFPGTLNLDMDEMATNLVPYPNLHFMVTSYSPIFPEERLKETKELPVPYHSTNQLTAALFRPGSFFASCDSKSGAYIACSLMFRGKFTSHEVSSAIEHMSEHKNKMKFVEWCPTGYKCGINSRPPSVAPDSDMAQMARSVCSVCNTTAIKEVFNSVADRFDVMYKKRAHLHWYGCEGVGSEDFEHSREQMRSLITDYDNVEHDPFALQRYSEADADDDDDTVSELQSDDFKLSDATE